MGLPLELQNEIARQARAMCEQYAAALHEVFFRLKQSVDQRKLFVMFEDILMCNPQSDHLIPKSTLPIFNPFIAEAEVALEKISAALLHASIYSFKEQVLSKEVSLRIDLQRRLEELEANFAREVSMNQRSAESISYLYAQQGKLTVKLQHVQQIKREGQVSSTRFGGIFKPDYQMEAPDVVKKGSLEDRIRSMQAQLEVSKQRIYKTEKALAESAAHNARVIQELNAENRKLADQNYCLYDELHKMSGTSSGFADGSNAAESETHQDELRDMEDAKKVIRYLNEQLYDAKLLSQKLGEKLRAKNRIIGLSVGVTNYFSRISGVNRVIAQSPDEKASDPLNAELMEEYFTYLAKLQLYLKELESQNGVLRVALQTQEKVNERVFGEAVLEPELISDSYQRFLDGQNELQDMLSSGTRGVRTLASIMEETAAQYPQQTALDAQRPGSSAFSANQQTIDMLVSENQRLKEQLAKAPETPLAKTEEVVGPKSQPSSAEVFTNKYAASGRGNRQLEDREASSGSNPPPAGYKNYTMDAARPLEQAQKRSSELYPEPYINDSAAKKSAYDAIARDDRAVSTSADVVENAGNDLRLDADEPEALLASSEGHARAAIQSEEAPEIESRAVADSNKCSQQSKSPAGNSNADSGSDEDRPRDLFMLNENLMRTIEYSSEIDDSRIDRELILLESWESEAEEGRQQPPEALTQACTVRIDYKKLLKIVYQQRYKIQRSQRLVHDLLEDKQRHEGAGSSPENTGKSLQPLDQLLDGRLKGSLIIPKDFRHKVLDKHNGIVAPSGLIVLCPKQPLSSEETKYIYSSAEVIGADIQINPELKRFIQIIEFESQMIGEDPPLTNFSSVQQASDYLRYLSERFFALPSSYIPVGQCPAQLGLLVSSETQTAFEVPVEQLNSTSLRLTGATDAPAVYMAGDPLLIEDIGNENATDYEQTRGDSIAAVLNDGKKVKSNTVADVFNYLNGIFSLDYSREPFIVQYLADYLKYLVSQQECATAMKNNVISHLRGQLDDALQAQRDFSDILSGWRSVGIQTNGEVIITIEYRLYTAKQMLIDKHKRIAIPEYCTSENDVFARLYNHALRIQRQIEYVEAKYSRAQCQKLGIIELKIRAKNARPNFVKPLLVRPDGRDYNARGRILQDAGLSKDPLSKEHFTIAVKPFK